MEDFEEAARVCGAGDCGEFELGGDVSGDGGVTGGGFFCHLSLAAGDLMERPRDGLSR